MADDNTVNVEFAADTAQAETAVSDLATKLKDASEGMGESFSSMTTLAVAFGTAMEKLAEQAFEKIKEALHEATAAFAETGHEIEHMQLVLGGTPEKLSELDVALKAVGVSSSTYESVAFRLSKQMQTSTDAFDKYGVAYKNANGQMLDTPQIISNVIDKLKEYEAGTDRNTVGTELLGRGFRSLTGLMLLSKEEMAEAKKVADDFGLSMSEKDLEAAHAYEVQTNLTKEATKGFYVELGRLIDPYLTDLTQLLRTELLPIFEDMRVALPAVASAVSSAFSSIGGAVKSVFDLVKMAWDTCGEAMDMIFGLFGVKGPDAMTVFMAALGMVKVAFTIFSVGAQTICEHVGEAFKELGMLIDGVADAVTAFFTAPLGSKGDAAKAAYDAALGKIEIAFKEHQARLRQIAIDGRKAVDEAVNPQFKSPDLSGHTEKPKGKKAAPPGTGDTVDEAGYMKQLEAELEARKITYEKTHDFRKMSLDDEAFYWHSAIAKAEAAGLDSEAIKLKANKAELAAMEKHHKDLLGLQQEAEKVSESAELAAVQQREDIANSDLALGKITKSELIDQQQKFEQERLAIQMRYQETRIAEAAKDVTNNPVAYQQALNKMLELQQQYNAKSLKLTAEKAKDDAKYQLSFESSLTGTLSGGITTLLTKWQSFRTSMMGILQGIYGDIVKNLIAQPLADTAVMLLKKTALYTQFSAFLNGLTVTESAVKKAATITDTTVEVTGAAAAGATKAGASVADIPGVGWMMVPGVVASTFALLKGMLPSFDVGSWNVPTDMMANIHAGEMIVPAAESEKIRDMASRGSGGNQHINITAFDAYGVQKLFSQHKAQILRAVHEATRNGTHLNMKFGG